MRGPPRTDNPSNGKICVLENNLAPNVCDIVSNDDSSVAGRTLCNRRPPLGHSLRGVGSAEIGGNSIDPLRASHAREKAAPINRSSEGQVHRRELEEPAAPSLERVQNNQEVGHLIIINPARF